jgi:hypothetical protein
MLGRACLSAGENRLTRAGQRNRCGSGVRQRRVKNRRVLPVMAHRGDPPLFVEVADRMRRYLQQMPTEQTDPITAAIDRAMLAALPLQMPTAALFVVTLFWREQAAGRFAVMWLAASALISLLPSIAHRLQRGDGGSVVMLEQRTDAG